MSAERNSNTAVVLLLGLSAVLVAIAPFVGTSMRWPLSELISGDGVAADIFWRVRLPRVALGFLAGTALGGGGLAFQALFRNPLASPYTFGVAAGASFGAASAIRFGLTGYLLGLSGVTIGGLIGALVTTFLIYSVACHGRPLSPAVMLLAGVAMSFFFSSLVLFLQYVSNFTQSFYVVRWLMGGLEVVDYGVVIRLLPFVLIGSCLLLASSREFDAVSTGEELALSRGVDVSRVTKLLFFGISLMIGATVSFTGPIGFVGIMVPHLCRILVGVSHRVLTPVVLVVSGAFLVTCDAVARVVVAPAEIPVGVLTALLGGPFFLWVLLHRRERL